MAEEPKGFMIVRVEEATGKNKSGENKWDSSDFEGFVKVEIRGGSQKVKLATAAVRVEGAALYWNQELVVEVLEGANELRLILCRKPQPGSSSPSVLAACGIYMSDILDAVPIDKYFELFKPGQAGDGGMIRVGMTYSPGPKKPMSAVRQAAEQPRQEPSDLGRQRAQQMDEEEDDDDDDDGKPLRPLIVAGAVAGVAAAAGLLLRVLRR